VGFSRERRISDGSIQLTRSYHPAAIPAKPRDTLACCARTPGTRLLRDYAAPHANARAQLFAMGEGGPPGPADAHVMPADNRQTRGNSLQ
jgi:hypothetical protein